MVDDAPSGLPEHDLHAQELDALGVMRPARRMSFAGGRLAMRRALQSLGMGAADGPVLTDRVGAPIARPGTIGSISHTHGLAAALVCVPPSEPSSMAAALGPASRDDARWAVGIDVESVERALNPKLAVRCLHPDERATLGARPHGGEPGASDSLLSDAASDLLLRVSLKEALYKALHPLVHTPIRWHSVQVQPLRDGSCTVVADDLRDQLGLAELHASAAWRVCDGFVVSTARARVEPMSGVVVAAVGGAGAQQEAAADEEQPADVGRAR